MTLISVAITVTVDLPCFPINAAVCLLPPQVCRLFTLAVYCVLSKHTCARVPVCMCVRVCGYLCVCVCLRTGTCVYMCACVRVPVCGYLRVCARVYALRIIQDNAARLVMGKKDEIT